jgi:hypothetical protein
VGRTDTAAPGVLRPVDEALLSGQCSRVSADRQGHKVAVERRGGEIHTREDAPEYGVNAAVKQLLFAVEPDIVHRHIKTGTEDLLGLKDFVADVISAQVATGTIDHHHVG